MDTANMIHDVVDHPLWVVFQALISDDQYLFEIKVSQESWEYLVVQRGSKILRLKSIKL